jgi:HD-like signal output (HDOD) protein
MKPGVISYRNFPSVGLTYDVGMIILLQFYPERFNGAVRVMDQIPSMHFYDAELSLGFEESSHQEIGAYFLEYWNLPEVFVETALFHHCPHRSSDQYRDIVEMTNYIEILTESVYKMEEADEEAISDLREEFIPKKTFRIVIEDIHKTIEDRTSFLIPYS